MNDAKNNPKLANIRDRLYCRISAVTQRVTGAPRAFWREIAAVLAAKAVALIVIYLLFFAAPASMPDLGIHLFQKGSAK